LPAGKQYALNIAKEGYLIHSENFALENIKSVLDPFFMIIELQKIPEVVASTTTNPLPSSEPITKPIVLKNVFFETGSAELKPISIVELDKLYNFLSKDLNLRIQLNGHTDNVGSDSDNMMLSDARANAVKEYLQKKGIASDRLRAKGFGETVPVASNDTDEGRRQNRRTEFQLF
jgi:outer membrane protein OmpA-like peptidoglycan-associated protein